MCLIVFDREISGEQSSPRSVCVCIFLEVVARPRLLLVGGGKKQGLD